MDDRRCFGFVLPLVLVVVMCIALLLTALLGVPGGMRRYAHRASVELQAIYLEESALVASLARLPAQENLPPVEAESVGPWLRLCARVSSETINLSEMLNGRIRNAAADSRNSSEADSRGSSTPVAFPAVCVLAGAKFASMSYGEWIEGAGRYADSLRLRILASNGLRHHSGNRRVFRLDSPSAERVESGDLLLDIDGEVSRGEFVVDGDARVRGRALYDTLRLYARGNVILEGNVQVRFLETVAGGNMQIAGNVLWTGIAIAREGFEMSGSAKGEFPSVLMAVGGGRSRGSVSGKARIHGLLAVPGGLLEIPPAVGAEAVIARGVLQDTLALLPAFYAPATQVFERSVVR